MSADDTHKLTEAYGYATRLACSIHEKHWPENTEWKPLPDLIGLLTQIDNMATLMDDQKDTIKRLEITERAAENVANTLNGGFITCNRCGDEVEMTNIDFADDLYEALGIVTEFGPYPTEEAYQAACKALHHWREEAKRLAEIAGEKPREMGK